MSEGTDLFADEPDPRPRGMRRCGVGRLLDAANERSRELLLERLHSNPHDADGWTDDQLSRALNRRVSRSLLQQHRNDVCACDYPAEATEGPDR